MITYTVIMLIIANFFTATDADINDLMTAITSGTIFEFDLNTENLEAMTLMSCTVLMYVLNYIYSQVPQISKMILSAFNVEEKKGVGEKLGDDLIHLGGLALDKIVQTGKTIVSGGEDDAKKKGSK